MLFLPKRQRWQPLLTSESICSMWVMEKRKWKRENGKLVTYCYFIARESYVNLIITHCETSISFQQKTLT